MSDPDASGRLESLARDLGADFFGVADLAPAREFIAEQGGQRIATYPRAVSVGIELPHAIVDRLPDRADRSVALSYQSHAYQVVNQRLDQLVSRLGSALQSRGSEAYPVAASQIVDTERERGVFSHKLAARLAGLGWIGKSCLLVTPTAGPRVRWATVLTDAPLQAAAAPMAERCGSGTECVEVCPVRAFTGRAFDPGEPREARYDVRVCHDHQNGTVAGVGVPICGMCLYVCPFGRLRAKRGEAR